MILVTGATGLNGRELIRQLSARGIALRALVRSVAKAAELSSLPGVGVVIGDMARPETLPAALRDVDRAMLISSSDPAMLEVQSNFIAAAAKAGVKHVVKLSGIMPDLDSPFRFARMHGEIEKRLEASGMAYTHLRAGEFMPAYFRQVPSIVAKGLLFLPMENAKIASIDVGDIAEVAATVLTSSGHEGKIYPLTGPEALSMVQVAEKLSAATGNSIRYVNVPPDDAKKAQLSADVPPYLADALAELFAERRKGKEAQVSPIVQTLLGRRPTSFDEFAAFATPRSFAANNRRREPDPRRTLEQNMKYFLIRYRLKDGLDEQRRREMLSFISALNDEPALSGRISYRCMKTREGPDYYHLAAAADDQTVQDLQSREFFTRYTEQTDLAADGEVEVLPLEIIAETKPLAHA